MFGQVPVADDALPSAIVEEVLVGGEMPSISASTACASRRCAPIRRTSVSASGDQVAARSIGMTVVSDVFLLMAYPPFPKQRTQATLSPGYATSRLTVTNFRAFPRAELCGGTGFQLSPG